MTARSLFVAIRSDDLFPPHQTEEMVAILHRHKRAPTNYFLLDSAYGHDAFLVEQDKMLPTLRNFMAEIEPH